ncbi:MAG: aminotransferase class I/II-fold pyridoxal phosphate-dependent enzyme [Clostridiales bacterium]|nr:aminotransferase class I/II-fold pyridoxal phosphate-dependent enzyme [Clostridiales bacterium]
MQAIILAAGMGKRLKELTEDQTKCMVKVNGITLIERMLSQLDRLNLSGIVVVVGYEAEKLISFISGLSIHTPIMYVRNDVYDKTNNIYSLYLARRYLEKEDTLLLESDLIFSDGALQKLVSSRNPSAALVARYESWMDGTVVTLDKKDNITSFIDRDHFRYDDIHLYYKTVNIYKFSRQFSITHYVPFLEAYIKAQGDNAYYEQVLKVIGTLGNSELKAVKVEEEDWYEIDDIQDLNIAESLFPSSPEEKLRKLQCRYGGYWRYPKLLDFCYLVNPFFPPQRMYDEIKASMEKLICRYPSGMDINCLLAAKCFGLDRRHICVGNGAAELISSLAKTIGGKIGIVYPTFEEYPNRIDRSKIVAFYPKNNDFSYGAEDLIRFCDKRDIQSLLLINPDNPSGNFIGFDGLLQLARWAEGKGVRLIVDESFVDFIDAAEPASLLSKALLREYPHLVVVKSISKSYGVPGLRLGVLASADTGLIDYIRSDLAIWNINSFAEFFLQILEKYAADYRRALERFREARTAFVEELRGVENLRVLPSQANFVMCQLLGSRSAAELARDLLNDCNILIKDLSSKSGVDGQYIRVAVRRPEENAFLVSAIRKIMGKEAGHDSATAPPEKEAS